MARPRTTRITEPTVADLREEFLDRRRAKNLSPRTMEWYQDRTLRFSDWCLERGILLTRDVTADDLEAFVLSLQAGPYKPQTVRGFANHRPGGRTSPALPASPDDGNRRSMNLFRLGPWLGGAATATEDIARSRRRRTAIAGHPSLRPN